MVFFGNNLNIPFLIFLTPEFPLGQQKCSIDEVDMTAAVKRDFMHDTIFFEKVSRHGMYNDMDV